MPDELPVDMLVPGAVDCNLDKVLAHYHEFGYARLGVVCTDDGLEALRIRSDDIMLGRVRYDGMFFQLDTPTQRYEDLVFGRGYEGPSLAYRKVEKLERDPLFLAWLGNRLFERVCRRVYSTDAVQLYRAVLFSKMANGGSNLPWHQDAGGFWGLSDDPKLQIWTALDDASEDAGCVEVVPGSHRAGLVTPLGGVVPKVHAERKGVEQTVIKLPARAGEALLIHNYVWHRSAQNTTPNMRRGFTVCYLDGKTRCIRKKRAPREFVRVF